MVGLVLKVNDLLIRWCVSVYAYKCLFFFYNYIKGRVYFDPLGIEGRQVLPEARLYRSEPRRIRGSWSVSEEVSPRGLRRETSPGQFYAESGHQDEHTFRRYTI